METSSVYALFAESAKCAVQQMALDTLIKPQDISFSTKEGFGFSRIGNDWYGVVLRGAARWGICTARLLCLLVLRKRKHKLLYKICSGASTSSSSSAEQEDWPETTSTENGGLKPSLKTVSKKRGVYKFRDRPLRKGYEVHEGYIWRHTGNTTWKDKVAVKIISANSNDDKAAKIYLKEIEAMRKIKPENNMNVLLYEDFGDVEYETDYSTVYIATQLCHKETLSEFLRSDHSIEDRKMVIVHICQGLRCIHQHGIAHRDLKPSNVLLTLNGKNAVIADFGLSKFIAKDKSNVSVSSTLCGTLGWIAPEMSQRTDASSIDFEDYKNADLFQLGLLIHYIFTKSHPFPGRHGYNCQNNMEKSEPLRKLEVLRETVSVDTDMAERLILSLLDKDPKKRPSTEQVLQHPLFWSADKKLNFIDTISEILDAVSYQGNSGKSEHISPETRCSSAGFNNGAGGGSLTDGGNGAFGRDDTNTASGSSDEPNNRDGGSLQYGERKTWGANSTAAGANFSDEGGSPRDGGQGGNEASGHGSANDFAGSSTGPNDVGQLRSQSDSGQSGNEASGHYGAKDVVDQRESRSGGGNDRADDLSSPQQDMLDYLTMDIAKSWKLMNEELDWEEENSDCGMDWEEEGSDCRIDKTKTSLEDCRERKKVWGSIVDAITIDWKAKVRKLHPPIWNQTGLAQSDETAYENTLESFIRFIRNRRTHFLKLKTKDQIGDRTYAYWEYWSTNFPKSFMCILDLTYPLLSDSDRKIYLEPLCHREDLREGFHTCNENV